MSSPGGSSNSLGDGQIAEVADEFLSRLARGESPDAAEYVTRYPQLAALFTQVLPAFAALRGEESAAGEADHSVPAGRAPLVGMLGQYRIEREIGRGGMGVVYEATHVVLDQRRAIKALPPDFNHSPNAFERFQREVRAAASLDHPHIVRAYDAGCERGFPYLVMELVDGTDLAALVTRQGPLPPALALGYVLQAARGLEYAHRKGMIHRDVKPSNLLVDREGRVRVSDLGLVRMADAARGNSGSTARDEGLTLSGQIVGSLDYMAPEQAEDSLSVDQRADIYSLGCTLYRLLTGDPPYGGKSLCQRLLAHHLRAVPSLRTRLPEVSPEVDALFQRMVAKRPDDRFATMTDVIAALEPLCRDGADGGRPSAAARRHSKPTRGVLLGVALVALAAALAAWIATWRAPQPVAAVQQQPEPATASDPVPSTQPVMAVPAVAPGTSPNVQLLAATPTPDETTARWVLGARGKVAVRKEDGVVEHAIHVSQLPEPPFQLVQVRLEDQPALTDEYLIRLGDLPHLELLYVSSPLVTDEGVRQLSGLPHLRELSLRGTQTTDRGVVHLTKLTTLTSLSLYKTDITGEACRRLAQLPNLADLAISRTKVDDAGLASLAALPRLKSLQLAYTSITDAGLQSLSQVQSLTTLNLEYTPITNRGLSHLHALPKLERLYLAGTRVTEQGVAALETALPGCQILSR